MLSIFDTAKIKHYIEYIGTVFWTMALFLITAVPAHALPSFAAQTGQPCSACHVGAFGPQLKPFARDFKLFGYVSQSPGEHGPPLAVMLQTSFTHTEADQPGGAAPGFGPNNN